MTLLDALQQINRSAMDSAQLTDMAIGTVTSTNPLEVNLDIHQAALKGDVLIPTDTVRPESQFFREVNGEVCIAWGQASGSSTLAVNDKVLLLSVQHGQRYIILSRL